MKLKLLIFFCIFVYAKFQGQSLNSEPKTSLIGKVKTSSDLKVGAQRIDAYLPKLKAKSVGFVGNNTSMIENISDIDTLLKLNIKIKKVFSPEHGFSGNADAGQFVENGHYKSTHIPLISLYGKKMKPTSSDLKGLDIVLFDIQDVGVRCYTYLNTLQYVMESCAENNIELIILDRPNPNGYFIDGPVLDSAFKSPAIGLDPIPLVYGMTLGEFAQMINGEKWLKNGIQCHIDVITIENYEHSDYYQLPNKPSPNLATMSAVYLYPSLVLFEGTNISVGRGTDKPFQLIGHPLLKTSSFYFIPHAIKGSSSNPPYKDIKCYGYDLSSYGEVYLRNLKGIYLFWIKSLYNETEDKSVFFNNYFNLLAGNDKLKEQIINGESEQKIKDSWQPKLTAFKKIRKKYLLYKDFN